LYFKKPEGLREVDEYIILQLSADIFKIETTLQLGGLLKDYKPQEMKST
jgi:hypothetical protein